MCLLRNGMKIVRKYAGFKVSFTTSMLGGYPFLNITFVTNNQDISKVKILPIKDNYCLFICIDIIPKCI